MQNEPTHTDPAGSPDDGVHRLTKLMQDLDDLAACYRSWNMPAAAGIVDQARQYIEDRIPPF